MPGGAVMVGVTQDKRAGGERPRLTLRQRLSIKHIHMIWDAVVERVGRPFRRTKKKRTRRKKQEVVKQMQKEIEPQLKTVERVRSVKSARDSRAGHGCLATACGCFGDHSRRSRLTITDSDAPPVYSNDDIINDIVPPLNLTQPPRRQ